MKLLIAGSRGISDYNLLELSLTLSNFEDIKEIVSGGANGVDQLGERFATENNIKITQFIPNWAIGNMAGIVRNSQMSQYCDKSLIIWDGESPGTKNMIYLMKLRKKPLFIYNTKTAKSEMHNY